MAKDKEGFKHYVDATIGSNAEMMSKNGAQIVTYVLKGQVHQGDNAHQCSSTW